MAKVTAKNNFGLKVKKDGVMSGYIEELKKTDNGKLYVFTSGSYKEVMNERRYKDLIDSSGGKEEKKPEAKKPEAEKPEAEKPYLNKK